MADSKVTRDDLIAQIIEYGANYGFEVSRDTRTVGLLHKVDAYALQCRREEREKCKDACDSNTIRRQDVIGTWESGINAGVERCVDAINLLPD